MERVYENIELINRLKVPITLFIVPSFLDKDNYLSTKRTCINIKKSIHKNSISYTLNHFDLTILDNEVLKEELTCSKNRLESLCGVLVDSVCYPKGLFNSKIVDFALILGYRLSIFFFAWFLF